MLWCKDYRLQVVFQRRSNAFAQEEFLLCLEFWFSHSWWSVASTSIVMVLPVNVLAKICIAPLNRRTKIISGCCNHSACGLNKTREILKELKILWCKHYRLQVVCQRRSNTQKNKNCRKHWVCSSMASKRQVKPGKMSKDFWLYVFPCTINHREKSTFLLFESEIRQSPSPTLVQSAEVSVKI